MPVVSSSIQEFGLQGHYEDASSERQPHSPLQRRRAAPGHEDYRYSARRAEDTENYRFNEWTSPYFKPFQAYNYCLASPQLQPDPAEAGNYRFRKADRRSLYGKWPTQYPLFISHPADSAAPQKPAGARLPADTAAAKKAGPKKKQPRRPAQSRVDNFGFMERKHYPTDAAGKPLPTIFRRRYYFVLSDAQPARAGDV